LLVQQRDLVSPGLFSAPSTTLPNTVTMSLFGNLGGSQPASSGTSGGGLFGTAGGASGGTTSSLFGNLGGGTSNAQSGTTQATSSGGLGGSLFGGLGGAKSTATATPSLFAAAAPTSQPQQQPQSQPQTGAFSLFSNPAAQSTTNNAQQTGGLGQSSLFNTTSTQQQAPQQPQQQGASLAQANTGSSRSAHFDHLLERGRKRNAGENGTSNFDELPSLQLGLGDIARKVRNLGAGGPSADQVQDRAQDRAA
jgi:nuclear pore complex protein Nup93